MNKRQKELEKQVEERNIELAKCSEDIANILQFYSVIEREFDEVIELSKYSAFNINIERIDTDEDFDDPDLLS